MRHTFKIGCALLGVAVLLGFWFQYLGLEQIRFAERLRIPPALWPFAIPGFGAIVTAAMFAARPRGILQLWSRTALHKGDVRLAITVLFGPALALVLQIYVGLMGTGVSTVASATTSFAAFQMLFFLAIGNYTTTIAPGASFGFRTPWTLADERIWAKTHRFVGFGFCLVSAAGLAALLILPASAVITMHIVLLLLINGVAAFYSRSLSSQ
ncbi:SdpI family protein [Erythrobacter mangrovi]|uniref:SdpI family protein n=1 Tax=Erythrobacter mangrovi TaxID=2739433 RepID=A0A7D4B627_9SPHN|nr:SdpI family protein [Erythrobacter mangrovi]QKG69983.1 SdpI family protein [Erythrobacter mangrovi]